MALLALGWVFERHSSVVKSFPCLRRLSHFRDIPTRMLRRCLKFFFRQLLMAEAAPTLKYAGKSTTKTTNSLSTLGEMKSIYISLLKFFSDFSWRKKKRGLFACYSWFFQGLQGYWNVSCLQDYRSSHQGSKATTELQPVSCLLRWMVVI